MSFRAAISLALVFGGFGLGVMIAHRPIANAASAEQPTQLDELRKAFEEFKKEQEKRDEDISRLSRTSPPVGSVTSFAGVWPPHKSDETRWTENEIGWLLCDGREIKGDDFAELRAVLRGNRLPDYRGYFLHGLDSTGKIDKGSLDGDKRMLRTLGSSQGYLTALPQEKRFKTGDQSDNPGYSRMKWIHSFVFSTGRNQSADHFGDPKRPQDWEHPKTKGDHHHEVTSGGDPETRPINVSVHYIIKFK